MKKTSLIKRILGGFGNLLLADLICFFINLTGANFYDYLVVEILAQVLCLAAAGGMLFSYGYKYGQQDRKLEKRGMGRDLRMALKLALIVILPPLAALVCLALSGAGLVLNLLPAYQIANSYFMPVLQMFSQNADVLTLHVAAYPILFVLTAAIGVAIYFGYDLGYRDVDVTLKIFYKKKS